MTDWRGWHDRYDDPASPLSGRLRAVQAELARALDRAPAGPLRLLSLCAGQARDVAPVLADHPRGGDVTGLLVELDPDNCVAAGTILPSQPQVRQGDAGSPAVWADSLPVDVLLLCGIFGNIPDRDVEQTVRAAPLLCRPGASVLWTRHTGEPDLTAAIRGWVAAAGMTETAFVHEHEPAGDDPCGGDGWAVGAAVVERPRSGPVPDPLFAFSR